MPVEIKNMPEFRVGTVRHVGPYNQIPPAFERLGGIAAAAGLLSKGEATMLALYHDDPDTVPPAKLRSDAAIVIPEPLPIPEGLVERRVPAGRYACAVHIGPYEKLGEAWDRFKGEGLSASGHRAGEGSSYEIYRNDPTRTPPAELRTEMYIPLA